MPVRERRYPKEEMARRGQEIYLRDIKPTLKPEDDGKYVAIDIETGMYEIDADDKAVTNRLFARREEAQPWTLRVGYVATGRLGGAGSLREKPS